MVGMTTGGNSALVNALPTETASTAGRAAIPSGSFRAKSGALRKNANCSNGRVFLISGYA